MLNNKMDFPEIGITGFIINALLSLIVLYRWGLYIHDVYFMHSQSQLTRWNQNNNQNNINNQSSNPNGGNGSTIKHSYKKHVAYFLLLVANVCDLPMYASFIIHHDYVLSTYSFHKFEAAAVFGAFSLVISDWSAVLFEIREDSLIPFLFRNISLIAINILLSTISLINFIYCYSIDSLSSYADSEIYVAGLFIQIVAPFVLTCLMLHAGLKLYLRIHGASRLIHNNLTSNNNNSTSNGIGIARETSSQNINNGNNYSKNKEFQSALFHLIVLMTSLAITIFIQVTLNCLNYALGYHNSPNATVGPSMLYFTFTEFAPLSVLTLSLVFLLRSKPSKQGQQHMQHAGTNQDQSSSVKYAQKSLSQQYYCKSASLNPDEEDGVVGGSNSDEITSPFLTDRDGNATDTSYASSNPYFGNFRTNTYEYCIGTGDESGNFRASDSSRAPLRYGGYPAFVTSDGFSPPSNATSDNSQRHDDIFAAYDIRQPPSVNPHK